MNAARELLRVRGLSVSYGGINAVKGIDLSVAEGQMVCLIGANGAGKTTTLKALAGLIRPAAGRIHYNGRDITARPAYELVRQGLALVPEGRGVFGRLTVEENLWMGAYGRRDRARIAADLTRATSADFSRGALQLIETTAASNYHALQLHASRRLHRGLELLASYTYGHSLDDVSNGTGTSVVSSFTGSNPNNLRAERASSDFDLRQNLTVGFSYAVWRGWSVEGIFHAQTALPYTPLLGRDVAGNGDQNAANNQRPNLVPGQPLYLRSSAPPYRVANPAALAAPASGTYGDAGRNILRAAGMHQLDLAVLKDLRLWERLGLQFRTEFFNLFNHANFATPAASGNHLLTAGASFGLAQQMANESAGGFLGPLFQSGGPRSIQFGLKLLW